MWSGARAHDSGARGPGFDPTPKPRMAFLEALIALLSDNRLKNDFINLLYCDVKLNKYYYYYYQKHHDYVLQ